MTRALGRSSRSRGARQVRGATLVEVMLTAVILLAGLAAAGSVVVQTARQGRRTLTQAQAQVLAERELERLVALGCRTRTLGVHPCRDLMAEDDRPRRLEWEAQGDPRELEEGEEATGRVYTVRVDVDPPYEDAERGVPAVERVLVPGGRAANIVNVRVTVLWTDPDRGTLATAVQTRVSPDLPDVPVPAPAGGALAP